MSGGGRIIQARVGVVDPGTWQVVVVGLHAFGRHIDEGESVADAIEMFQGRVQHLEDAAGEFHRTDAQQRPLQDAADDLVETIAGH